MSEYADEAGEGRVTQTAEEACQRWLDKVGPETFEDQWTEEYAENYKRAFGS